MMYSSAFSVRLIACACVILAFSLAAALGISATTPASAYAESKSNVYVVTKITWNADDYKSTSKYAYANGLVKKVKSKMTTTLESSNSTFTYTYKSKNVLKQITSKYNGKLVKRVMKTGDQTEKVTYTYKKVSVPKSLAKMVEQQQRCIIIGTIPIETAHK